MLHTTVKLNCTLTRLPQSELISVCADYPELPLAPGGAEVTLCSTARLGPTSSMQRETHSGQTTLEQPCKHQILKSMFLMHSGHTQDFREELFLKESRAERSLVSSFC